MHSNKRQTELLGANLAIIENATRACDCCGDTLHYHALVYDGEDGGDEYFQESDDDHEAFIKELKAELETLRTATE